MMKIEELYKYLSENGWINDLDEDELESGDWYLNLPDYIQARLEVLMSIIIELLYEYWDVYAQNKLFEVFTKHYSNDQEFISEYLSRTSFENEFFVRTRVEIQSNLDLLMKYLHLGHPEADRYSSFIYLSLEVKNNRKLMLSLVKELPDVYQHFEDDMQDDEEITRIALQANGMLLKFASSRLRSKQELVSIAIQNNENAVLFADRKLLEFPDGIFYKNYLNVTNCQSR